MYMCRVFPIFTNSPKTNKFVIVFYTMNRYNHEIPKISEIRCFGTYVAPVTIHSKKMETSHVLHLII